MLYLDTSALLPYYREEARSAAVEELLQRHTSSVWISDLTRLEFASAVARWVRMGDLEEGQAQLITRAFDEDVTSGRFRISRNITEQIELARQWLLTRKTNLRTLDALHMACAASIDATLVTLDLPLIHAAAVLGVRVHDL